MIHHGFKKGKRVYVVLKDGTNLVSKFVDSTSQYLVLEDYIDDDKEGNKHYIGELKEDREHWKDIVRIIENKKLYMNNIIDYKGSD